MAVVNRKTIDYSLSIHTKDKLYAGTDNDVFITVYGVYNGEEVQTSEINLSALVNGNAFERNDTHNLSFQWEDIGRPTKIKLRLSNDLLDIKGKVLLLVCCAPCSAGVIDFIAKNKAGSSINEDRIPCLSYFFKPLIIALTWGMISVSRAFKSQMIS